MIAFLFDLRLPCEGHVGEDVEARQKLVEVIKSAWPLSTTSSRPHPVLFLSFFSFLGCTILMEEWLVEAPEKKGKEEAFGRQGKDYKRRRPAKAS